MSAPNNSGKSRQVNKTIIQTKCYNAQTCILTPVTSSILMVKAQCKYKSPVTSLNQGHLNPQSSGRATPLQIPPLLFPLPPSFSHPYSPCIPYPSLCSFHLLFTAIWSLGSNVSWAKLPSGIWPQPHTKLNLVHLKRKKNPFYGILKSILARQNCYVKYAHFHSNPQLWKRGWFLSQPLPPHTHTLPDAPGIN